MLYHMVFHMVYHKLCSMVYLKEYYVERAKIFYGATCKRTHELMLATVKRQEFYHLKVSSLFETVFLTLRLCSRGYGYACPLFETVFLTLTLTSSTKHLTLTASFLPVSLSKRASSGVPRM